MPLEYHFINFNIGKVNLPATFEYLFAQSVVVTFNKRVPFVTFLRQMTTIYSGPLSDIMASVMH